MYSVQVSCFLVSCSQVTVSSGSDTTTSQNVHYEEIKVETLITDTYSGMVLYLYPNKLPNIFYLD